MKTYPEQIKDEPTATRIVKLLVFMCVCNTEREQERVREGRGCPVCADSRELLRRQGLTLNN